MWLKNHRCAPYQATANPCTVAHKLDARLDYSSDQWPAKRSKGQEWREAKRRDLAKCGEEQGGKSG